MPDFLNFSSNPILNHSLTIKAIDNYKIIRRLITNILSFFVFSSIKQFSPQERNNCSICLVIIFV